MNEFPLALLTGAISLTAIWITRLSKLSDMRERWIVELRKDIGDLLVLPALIATPVGNHESEIRKRAQDLPGQFERLISLGNAVMLKINGSNLPKSLTEELNTQLHSMITLLKKGDFVGANAHCPLIREAAEKLLSHQWQELESLSREKWLTGILLGGAVASWIFSR